MEHLRIVATQQSLLEEDDHIKYVNTAAFAIRRSLIDPSTELFNIRVVRGEDTLLLAKLAEIGKLPLYVANAIVVHSPNCKLVQYIFKHFYIGYFTSPARKLLNYRGDIIMTVPKRLKMFRNMQKIAISEKIYLYSYVVLFAYLLECSGRLAYSLFGIRPGNTRILNTNVDAITKEEIIARIISCAEKQKGYLVTYLTAWTLVLSMRNPKFGKLLTSFDLRCADGMGVVVSLFLTKFRRIKKVTLHDYYMLLIKEIANRKLKVALVGGAPELAERAAQRMRGIVPSLNICLCHHGYFSFFYEEQLLKNDLIKAKPHILFIGMSQPFQEQWINRTAKFLPNSVFICVGAFFEYITVKELQLPIRMHWIRNVGFEWLWRLVHDPKRLWKRYLLGLPLLGFYILRQLFKVAFYWLWPRRIWFKPGTDTYKCLGTVNENGGTVPNKKR